MSTVNELTVQEVREKIVAIVKFGPAGFDTIEVLGAWGENNEPPLLAYGAGGAVGMGVLIEKDKEPA